MLLVRRRLPCGRGSCGYDEYIRRFNAEDASAFDEFLSPSMWMQNGTLIYHGVQMRSGGANHDRVLRLVRAFWDRPRIGCAVCQAFRAWTRNPIGPVERGRETLLESLKNELAVAEAELRAHMASWEYAFAMGSSRDGASNHPLHQKTRERTDLLVGRCRDLRARLAEHEV